MSTRFPFGRFRSTVAGVAVIAAAIAGVALSQGPAAHAQVAAKVESQTRPNFGLLLDPPTRSYRNRGSHHRRYDYGRHRPDWRPDYPSYRPGGEEIVLVDCGGNPGTGAVEDAVRRVRPGGTLVIRARGGLPSAMDGAAIHADERNLPTGAVRWFRHERPRCRHGPRSSSTDRSASGDDP